MWFRLAALWGCTVREAQARCDSAEFTEWMAFYSIVPFGPERIDVAAGVVASVVANSNRSKGQRPFTIHDFTPLMQVPKPSQSREEMRSNFMAFKRAIEKRRSKQ